MGREGYRSSPYLLVHLLECSLDTSLLTHPSSCIDQPMAHTLTPTPPPHLTAVTLWAWLGWEGVGPMVLAGCEDVRPWGWVWFEPQEVEGEEHVDCRREWQDAWLVQQYQAHEVGVAC